MNRIDLVALGLLLGSDYCPGGVPGVGKKLALQLVRAWKRKSSSDLLERFHEWKTPQFQEGTRHASCCTGILYARTLTTGLN